MPPPDVGVTDGDISERLTADARREALLDVTRTLVHDVGPAGITMGAVADRAAVTRALVYKHFDNKDDLLVELYRREAGRIDKQIRVTVEAADDDFESKLRAFVTATLDAVGETATFFAPLREVSSSQSARRDKRTWDTRSVRYFGDLAATEFVIDQRTARSVISILFSGVQSLVAQATSRQGADRRKDLEDTYVDAVLGALERVSSRAARGVAE